MPPPPEVVPLPAILAVDVGNPTHVQVAEDEELGLVQRRVLERLRYQGRRHPSPSDNKIGSRKTRKYRIFFGRWVGGAEEEEEEKIGFFFFAFEGWKKRQEMNGEKRIWFWSRWILLLLAGLLRSDKVWAVSDDCC